MLCSRTYLPVSIMGHNSRHCHPSSCCGHQAPSGGWSCLFEARMNSSHLPWGPRFYFAHLPFYHKMPACLAQQASPQCQDVFCHSWYSTLGDKEHGRPPSVFFWTAFYMFSNIKSWQLHLILFMKLLSHVFLLKVFMSRTHLCCVVDCDVAH